VGLAEGESAVVTSTSTSEGVEVVSIEGEIDLASVESVGSGIELCLRSNPDRVIFDLEKLTFMDSSGIALLLQVANEVEEVELRNVKPNVRRVLEVTGLLERFGLV
jgi:anti-sigma B factor antagonist